MHCTIKFIDYLYFRDSSEKFNFVHFERKTLEKLEGCGLANASKINNSNLHPQTKKKYNLQFFILKIPYFLYLISQ